MTRKVPALALLAGIVIVAALVWTTSGLLNGRSDAVLPSMPASDTAADDAPSVPCDSCSARHQRLKRKRSVD